MNAKLTHLDWNKMQNLIPAIIQDAETKLVLMLGYMNKEALEQTIATGKVTFYSRSKKRLWTKGETSGNELILVDITADCDNDTLLIYAKPKGPCCHFNTPSCFDLSAKHDILTTLIALITQRYQTLPKNSYVTELFNAGTYKIAQKVGEEGVELALASVSSNKENTINEAADLIFHMLVLLQQCQVDFSDVLAELSRRHRP